MRTHESVEARLSTVVRTQYGVFTRRQAIESGASEGAIDRRLADGKWERLHSGVYRVAGATPSWFQQLMTALLVKGPASALSHLSAAALVRLPGFHPGPVELIVPRTSRKNRIPGIVVRRCDLASVDVVNVRRLRVTTVARTIIDLASIAPGEIVEEALDDALRRRLVTLSRLRWRALELGGRGRPGSAIIRRLIEARYGSAALPESVFETKALRRLRRVGVPELTLQHQIRDGSRRIATVDFALPDLRIAIEADGYRWHGGRAVFERDLARRNAITAVGWELLHLTWADLADPRERAIRTILQVIDERSRKALTPHRTPF